ncbi:MAG: efflux RND transporter periplasmic adaptor subunit [Fimbriimonadaceae bacterium]|nr:efflux RND transporter periplasmic adaptor subunit [Fimbriimonadaceae bacterium]QYK55394.1 MAG: efflux RND transporter periplasmic adaptor subunit [Fimbriimonadaceae bacterium]
MILVLLGILVVVGSFAFQQFQKSAQAALEAKKHEIKVDKGDVLVQVVDTGTLEAVTNVEVKSRVSGRIARLLVQEGQMVAKGDLIAEIDPQETQLQVDQNAAQVRGAEAGARRTEVEIAQRRVTARTALAKAQSRLKQLEMEMGAQPALTAASITTAESNLRSAREALQQLTTVTQPNERTAAEVAVRNAESRLENAKSEATRQKNLMDRGFVARRELENAELQVSLATTALRDAQENLSRLAEGQRLARQQAEERVRQAEASLQSSQINRVQDSVKREQYLQARQDVRDAETQLRDIEALIAGRQQQAAQIDQLRSVLRDGQRQLGETRILSPITGIVTRRDVQVGELVASLNSFSAGTTIVRIEDRDHMQVRLEINEIDVARLSEGMKAEVLVDAFPEKKFTGRVATIAPTNTSAGATTNNPDAVVKYEVKVLLDDPLSLLKSGMSAKCSMRVIDRKNVLRAPIDRVGKDEKGYFVMVPPDKPGPKAENKRIDVKVGAKSDTFYEIVSGVTEGQKLERPPFGGPERKGMMSFGPDEE